MSAQHPDADLLAELLNEGLDLCVRARKLDEQVERAVEAGMGRIFPEATRCMTPALWVQEHYDRDLAEWETRAKSTLLRLGFALELADDTPPGADAMERAKRLIVELNNGEPLREDDSDILPTARALQQYGDERAAAAREAAIEEALDVLDDEGHLGLTYERIGALAAKPGSKT